MQLFMTYLLCWAAYSYWVMPYKFTFDLSKTRQQFFVELGVLSNQKGTQKILLENIETLIKKFKVQETSGLDIHETVELIQDLLEMQTLNLTQKQEFHKTKKKAIFLPHCCRKYMDNRCQAVFDPSLPAYICAHCSPDCFVNKAEIKAKEKGYDFYVLSGGSCIPKILERYGYEGVVGVACGAEAMMSGKKLSSLGLVWQSVPLLKNGCANTFFSMETLEKTL
jgi:uncharacterized protein